MIWFWKCCLSSKELLLLLTPFFSWLKNEIQTTQKDIFYFIDRWFCYWSPFITTICRRLEFSFKSLDKFSLTWILASIRFFTPFCQILLGKNMTFLLQICNIFERKLWLHFRKAFRKVITCGPNRKNRLNYEGTLQSSRPLKQCQSIPLQTLGDDAETLPLDRVNNHPDSTGSERKLFGDSSRKSFCGDTTTSFLNGSTRGDEENSPTQSCQSNLNGIIWNEETYI